MDFRTQLSERLFRFCHPSSLKDVSPVGFAKMSSVALDFSHIFCGIDDVSALRLRGRFPPIHANSTFDSDPVLLDSKVSTNDRRSHAVEQTAVRTDVLAQPNNPECLGCSCHRFPNTFLQLPLSKVHRRSLSKLGNFEIRSAFALSTPNSGPNKSPKAYPSCIETSFARTEEVDRLLPTESFSKLHPLAHSPRLQNKPSYRIPTGPYELSQTGIGISIYLRGQCGAV